VRRQAGLRKYSAAIRVTTVLILGVRGVRAAYAEMLRAWQELMQTELGPVAPVVDDEAPLVPEPVAPAAPVIPDRAAVLQAHISRWAPSPQGQRVIRELRWLCPSLQTLAARVRAELPPTGTGVQQILSACRLLGIPVRSGEETSWGVGLPSWLASRAALQQPCSCQGPSPAEPTVCTQCGGTSLPQAVLAVDASPCCWCATAGQAICPGCCRHVHFQGLCRSWRSGAHLSFACGPLEERWLCPDCSWAWVLRLQQGPAASAAPSAPLFLHLEVAASACRLGAGAEVPAPEAVASLRGARRRVLRLLRLQGAWTSFTDLARIMDISLPENGAAASSNVQLLRRAVSLLLREGLLESIAAESGPWLRARAM
jgi:hypothetical protein